LGEIHRKGKQLAKKKGKKECKMRTQRASKLGHPAVPQTKPDQGKKNCEQGTEKGDRMKGGGRGIVKGVKKLKGPKVKFPPIEEPIRNITQRGNLSHKKPQGGEKT